MERRKKEKRMERRKEEKRTTSQLTLGGGKNYAGGREEKWGRQQQNSKEEMLQQKIETSFGVRYLKVMSRQNQGPFASQERATAHPRTRTAVASHRKTPKGPLP